MIRQESLTKPITLVGLALVSLGACSDDPDATVLDAGAEESTSAETSSGSGADATSTTASSADTEPTIIDAEPVDPGQLPDDTTDIPPLDPPDGQPEPSNEDGARIEDQLVGLTESDAMALAAAEGFDVRVEARDGEEFFLTQDHSEARINLTVADDVVTGVRRG
jgi:hypothetical protein